MMRKWQGTALFALVMAGVSATVAGRLLAGGGEIAGAATGATGASGATGTSGTPGTASGGTTVNGDVEQTPFGEVQVAVTFDGSKIVGVKTLIAPSESGRDEMLTQYAAPQLAKEIVASQSAKVDTISGATYTSQGYLASAQSAIDKRP